MDVDFNFFGSMKRRLRRKSTEMDAQINTDVVAHNICVYLWFQQKSIDTSRLAARLFIRPCL
jgi:hypothetical protein